MKLHPDVKIPENFLKQEICGHCTIIVHRGYSLYDGPGFAEKKNERIYGDYDEFSKNIGNLITKLKINDEPIISVVEKEVLWSPELYEEHSIENSLEISTSDVLFFNRQIRHPRNKYESEVDYVMRFLLERDVKQIRIAGEWVWWSRNGKGCVSVVVDKFRDNFEIKAIKGCIFPMIMPIKGVAEFNYLPDVSRYLYKNQIDVLNH